MLIREEPLEFYLNKLRNREYFSFPGYSDSEFFCMTNNHINEFSAAGQLHTAEIGERLRQSIRKEDPNWMPAVPQVLNGYAEIQQFNELTEGQQLFERDIVTDDLAAKVGGLQPLIRQLRQMDVYLVGNALLKGLFFLNYKKHFVTESFYNFHLVENGIDNMVKEILEFNRPGVYLFSVGVSDAVMISELHGKLNNSFLIDCGSIWDAFLGHGGNREWRKQLYQNPGKWVEWITANLKDV